MLLTLAAGMFYRGGTTQVTATPDQPAARVGGKTAPARAKHKSAEGPCKVIRDFLSPPDEPEEEESVTGKVSLSGKLTGSLDFEIKQKKDDVGDTSCGEGKLDYLIALVPDPVNTHLSLAFDRAIESIQGAVMSSQDYRFDRFYFPWETELSHEEPDLEKRTAQRKEKEHLEKNPGLLLFRNEKEQKRPLAVFLVAETPTSGVNRVQFSRAIFFTGNAPGQIWEAPVSIVGPTYSGGSYSLRRAMESASDGAKFDLFNGSATDQASLKYLSKGTKRWTVHNFVHSDEEAFRKFRSSSYLGSKIAILSEDETAFGYSDFDHTTLIRFPRDISHFRNAAKFLPDATSGAENVPLIRQLLPFDLHEAVGKDSVPTLSSQTASSQQAVLANITREVNEGRYSAVGIRATDVLDIIFLSRLVREASPDARLFVLDADLLLVRAAADAPLTGMLSVTTYPLLLANEPWTSGSSTAVPFSSRTAEALYNATLAALGSKTGYFEYASPIQKCDNKRPPIWITVLSRSGYWPVAVMDSSENLWKQESNGEPNGFSYETPDHLWFAAFGVATLLALAYACCVCYFNISSKPIQLWLEKFWVNPGEAGRSGRAAYLSTRTVGILICYLALVVPFVEIVSKTPSKKLWTVASLAALASLALLLSLVPPIYQVITNVGKCTPSPVTYGHLFILGSSLISGAFWSCVWLYQTLFPAQNQENYFLALRSINLSNGVSPALPLILAISGLIWWASMHLRRLILSNDRTPELPDIWGPFLGTTTQLDFAGMTDEIRKTAADPFLNGRWRVILAAIIFVAIVADPTDLFRTVEMRWIGAMMRCAIGMLASVTFLSWSRMIRIWSKLSRFLEHLERHPIRQAFSDLPKERTWSPVMQRGALKRTYLLEMRSLETARKIEASSQSQRWKVRLAGLAIILKHNTADIASGQRLSNAINTITFDLIQNMGSFLVLEVLLAEWRQGASETLSGFDEEREIKNGPPVLNAIEQRKKAASEFVVLPFVFFIRTILLQIRNLMFFVVAGYVLLVLAVSSYPFQSPRTLSWGLTISLLIFLTGLVWMLAQMSRDSILSRITETTPGKLDNDFFIKLGAAGALPVLSLVASQFPTISRFLFSWLQPTLQAIK